MTETPNLGLAYLQAAQAQKHVTVNEALRILDIVVQSAVLDKDLSAPPSSPAPNDKYLVAASATGLWANYENTIAAWIDEAWIFIYPKTGWQTYVRDESTLYIFDGSDWVIQTSENMDAGGDHSNYAPLTGATFTGNIDLDTAATPTLRLLTNLQDVITLGLYDKQNAASQHMILTYDASTHEGRLKLNTLEHIKFLDKGLSIPVGLGVGGATPDTINKLSVNTTAALFNNNGSDIRLTLNKASDPDDATLTFQNAFNTKAQMGLSANNDLTIKVGSAFTSALIIDETTGRVDMPQTPSLGEFVFNLGGQWLLNNNEHTGWSNSGPYHVLNTGDLGDVGADYLRISGGIVYPFDVQLMGFHAQHYNNSASAQAWGWRIGYLTRTHNSNVTPTVNLLQEVAENGGIAPRDYANTINQITDLNFADRNWIIPAGSTIVLGIEAPTADVTNRYVMLMSGYLHFKRVNN